ncbi:MAG: Hsp70 family protein, partial [Clostridia bacterium]|nr:Hsp70 family protein [Clostridia bacterium]
EDKKMKENIETKNNAENLVYQCEKTLADAGDKLTDADKAPVTAAVEKLKETLKTDNYDAIKQDTEALTQALYAVSSKLYQGANPGAQGFDPNSQGGGNSNNGEGYYNADFTDNSDNK